MTIAARLVWIAMALGLAGGGFVMASILQDRSGAMETLERAEAERTRLAAEESSLDERIGDLYIESRDQQDLQDTCRFELVRQERTWNQLLADIPSIIYSASDLDPYVARAREMVREAKEIGDVCADL